MRKIFLEIEADRPLSEREHRAIVEAYFQSVKETRVGGFVGEGFSACWAATGNRRTVLQELWLHGWFYPLRYLVSLRVRLIRRPLRTGKILGVTIMSFVNEPEMIRLP